MSSNATPHNIQEFFDCTFQNCAFYLATFIIPDHLQAQFTTLGWTGINWIVEPNPDFAIEPSAPQPQLPLEPEAGTPP
jgi:hypothetical protein